MKTGIISILLATILVLTPSLPALAQESGSGTITITMTGVETRVEIALDKENWALGEVTADTEYKTDSETSWCTITNTGNVNVDLGIKGENAEAVGDSSVKWFLSKDETNFWTAADPNPPKYVLWYHIADDTKDRYTPITTAEDQYMETASGKVSLEPEKTKQFGLKLLTPDSFEYYDKKMETHITISVVSPA